MRQVGEFPYFSQWPPGCRNGEILDGTLDPVDDPDWALSGAGCRSEYDFWSWHACGMACTQGVLSRFGFGVPSLVGLAREVWAAGGYRATDRGLFGLIYAPYVEWLACRWGVSSRVAAPCGVEELSGFVAAGGLAVASVHPSIRYAPAVPPAQGGHLVLVWAATGGGVSFDNPSGDSPETQRVVNMPVDVFSQYWAGRAILINNPTT